MRVLFNRSDNKRTVIEVVQLIRYDNDLAGLVMPYTKYGEARNYNYYKSSRAVEEEEFNRWCETLLRTGYLDLTRTDITFSYSLSTLK